MDSKENQEDSESIGSDESEEESELDEEESEKRRTDCVADMKELENQFLKLKEDLINEKFTVIDKKLFEIENEIAKEYTVPLLKLKENMEMKISIASLMREYKLKNVENTYLCEEETAKQSLQHDKLLLFDTLKDRIESDINQVEENRRLLYLEIKRHELLENENVSESNGYHQTPAPGASSSINLKRKLPKKLSTENENDRKKKSIAVTGPYIVYSLSDLDILEDWLAIKDYVEMNDEEGLIDSMNVK